MKLPFRFQISDFRFRRAFTLIEIMVVVAIIGLVCAMGLPSIIKVLQKEGMRKAISDVTDVCASARAKAIITQKTVAVVFHPGEKSFAVDGGGAGQGSTYVSQAKLPESVDFAMLDINQQDYGASAWARVNFFPNGTCDELVVVLHDRSTWRKISLEFATGHSRVSAVDR
jgi:prepilin-type N-terminal cleavage/methylation domain-containing protein